MIPLTVPALGDEEVEAASRVLRSGRLVQGAEVAAFERELAQQTHREHAVAVASGTSALELALRALGIRAGDEVLCPALTWPSPVHAVRAVGATAVLVDVDPAEWNVRESALSEAVTAKTRAAVVIDQFGSPARHAEIAEALGDVPVLVDAACSLGARYQGVPCGKHGVIACTSFHPRKVITTGEGGACFTDDAELAARLRTLRNHGQAAPGYFACASGNYRLTDFAAAVGRVQLRKLKALCAERLRLYAQLARAVPGLSTQRVPQGGEANRQTLGVLVGEPCAGPEARDAAVAAFAARGVQAGRLSYAVHSLDHMTLEREAAQRAGRSLSVALDVAERGLALPLFPGMTDAMLESVARAAGEVLGGEAVERG